MAKRTKESGAAGRKRRRKELEQARKEAALRGEQRKSAYADIPEAKDAASRVERAHTIASKMLDEVVTDPAIDEDKRRKQATDLLKAIGAMSQKSLYAARIAELERTVYGKRGGKGKPDASEDELEDLGEPATRPPLSS